MTNLGYILYKRHQNSHTEVHDESKKNNDDLPHESPEPEIMKL